MDTFHSAARQNNTLRSFNGCWTCRLRRKKCDEVRPICSVCSVLDIPCHYGQEKPEWMDNGTRQEEKAAWLKHQIKEKRRREGVHKIPRGVNTLPAPVHELLNITPDVHIHNNEMMREPCPNALGTWPKRGADCTLTSKGSQGSTAIGRSDTILVTFYLEHLFPFLFPFYRPSLLEGGKAWILEMMISSPVVRQATLCQSSYFFSLAQGTINNEGLHQTILRQAGDAFGVLSQALQVINDSGIKEHLHGAVRIMSSIMQVQRLEIAVLSFDNCAAHLSAAVAIFTQLLDSPDIMDPSSSFHSFMSSLESLHSENFGIPSAEQAAFRFSSALLIFDDIIASTILQEQPRLFQYHHSLLDGTHPAIDLEAVVGCQNGVLLAIGEISTLEAWKLQCKTGGNLEQFELTRRAMVIKESLQGHIMRLEIDPIPTRQANNSFFDVFTTDHDQQPKRNASQSYLVSRIWAHAALIYLSVVTSGWQPASVVVRYHVGKVIDLLTRQISSPTLLRTMVWPFCVAGCLVEPSQEGLFRGMVENLRPASVFGTVRKALEIMENAWGNREAGDIESWDLATLFKSQGHLVLLV